METARDALNKEIKRYRTQRELLNAIAESAQLSENGAVISRDLLEQVKRVVAA